MRYLCLVILWMISGFGVASALAENATSSSELPKVRAVYFYADWCHNCQIIHPILERARNKTKHLPVQHLTLNFTNAQTWDRAIETALDHDVVATYNAFAGTTGLVVLVAADTGEQIDCVNRQFSVDAMALAFTRAVERLDDFEPGKRHTGSIACPQGRLAPGN